MSGWTRSHLFWTMLSRGHRLCGTHVAYGRIQGAWRTRKPLAYTCVRMVLCQSFQSFFFKVLSLMHLTFLLLDFKIAKMIPLAKRRHAGPHEECVREECSEACESSYIKWMDSRNERVLGDVQGAATWLIPRWFRYVSD
jgi:hypothetical protein